MTDTPNDNNADNTQDEHIYTDPNTGKFRPRNPGRPKGCKGKFANVKQMVLSVLQDRLDGDEWLYWFSQQHPKEFIKLIDKLLPESLEVAGPDGQPISVDVRAQLLDKLSKIKKDDNVTE